MELRAFARLVRVPTVPPLKLLDRELDAVFIVILSVEDSDGFKGFSSLWALHLEQTPLVLDALRYIAPVVQAAPADKIDEVDAAVLRHINFLGLKSVTVFALSAFDMALHDLQYRRTETSLADQLGKQHDHIPAYWSALHVGASEAELSCEIDQVLERGFRAFKMRVGRSDLAADVRRVAVVRSLLPDEASLCVDAVQAWNADESIYFVKQIAELGVAWFEDPVVHHDYASLARVIVVSPVPIATGENEYLPEGFDQLCALRPAYVLADLQRAGGSSGWLKIATIAERAGAVLTPHLYPHIAVQLLAAASAPGPLEFVTWWDVLMCYELVFEGGMVKVPDVVGTGLDIDLGAVEHFAVSPWLTL